MNKLVIFLAFIAMVMGEKLIFSDEFDKLNMKTWQQEITMGGGGNWEFQMYLNNRTTSYVKDGSLYLQPILTEEIYGDAVTTGTIDLWGASPADMCTGNAFYGCMRSQPGSGNVNNPITSARIRTVDSFNFKYGKVEVRAQLPKGDWIWPAIWMLPAHNAYGQWPASGEIDIMESRGNGPDYAAGGNNVFGSTLHWGPGYQYNEYEKTHAEYTNRESLADDYHTYGLIWTEERIMTYIDDPKNKVLDVPITQSFWSMGEFPENLSNPWVGEPNNAPFNQEFYITMNVAVGGTNDYFPDGIGGKPWSNQSPTSVNEFWAAKDQWYPTWNYPETTQAAMKIDSVKVWDLSKEDSEPLEEKVEFLKKMKLD